MTFQTSFFSPTRSLRSVYACYHLLPKYLIHAIGTTTVIGWFIAQIRLKKTNAPVHRSGKIPMYKDAREKQEKKVWRFGEVGDSNLEKLWIFGEPTYTYIASTLRPLRKNTMIYQLLSSPTNSGLTKHQLRCLLSLTSTSKELDKNTATLGTTLKRSLSATSQN